MSSSSWQVLFFSLMLLIKYKLTKHFSYLSVCQQQKVKKNACNSGKSISHLTAATETKRATYYQHLKKSCSCITFFSPLSNKATMFINYRKKKKIIQSVGTLQLEHDDRKGISGDSSKDNLLKETLNCFQQSEMCFLFHDLMLQEQ